MLIQKLLLLSLLLCMSEGKALNRQTTPPDRSGAQPIKTEDNVIEYQKEKDAEATIEFSDGREIIHQRPSSMHLEPADETRNELKLTAQQKRELFGYGTQQPQSRSVSKRKFIAGVESVYLWDNDIVPWRWDDNNPFPENGGYQQKIQTAMQLYEQNTCIRFQQQDSINSPSTNVISIGHQSGCWSYLGEVGGNQELSIGKGCTQMGTIMHELGHSLGLYHEQSRDDRDEYVDVFLKNVKSDFTDNFDKAVKSYNHAEYDESSAMHYGTHAFSVNDQPTITADEPELQFLFGQREGFTFYDYQAVNFAYKCNETCSPISCYNGGYMGPRCLCVCPEGFDPNDQCRSVNQNKFHENCQEIRNIGLDQLNVEQQIVIDTSLYTTEPNVYECAFLAVPTAAQTHLEFKFEEFNVPCDGTVEVELRYNLPGQRGPTFCGSQAPIGKVFRTDRHKRSTQLSLFIRVKKPLSERSTSNIPVIKASVKLVDSTGNVRPPVETKQTITAPPPTTAVINQVIREGFEEDNIKNFTQTGDIMWTRHRDATPSSDTGPSESYEGDFYAYVEASSGAPGQKAILTTKSYYEGDVCIDIFYHMYGNEMGKLEVSALLDDGQVFPLWTQTSNENLWKNVVINLNAVGRLRIQIAGIIGPGYHSDMAIDDIYIGPAPCNRAQAKTSIKEDFERGIRAFKQTGTWDWLRETGPTASSGTGPSQAKQGHYYAYFETSSPVGTGEDATMVTKDFFDGTAPICVHFFYNMHGVDMGELQVFIEYVADNNNEKPQIWRQWGNQQNTWHEQYIDIAALNVEYRVGFRALKGTGYMSDIAIDDITMTTGKCSQEPFKDVVINGDPPKKDKNRPAKTGTNVKKETAADGPEELRRLLRRILRNEN